jgi:protein involved in polysaccharide export with SLBB domain
MLVIHKRLFIAVFLFCCLCGVRSVDAVPTAPADARIRPFDKLDIIVNDEPELSGAYTGSDRGFDVDARGLIDYPLIGKVTASGLTTEELQEFIRLALSKEYVREPKVRVRFSLNRSLRTLVLLGRVKKPGNYEIVPDATVVKMISAAGGFFRDANLREVVLTRASEVLRLNVENILKGEISDVPVLAGDTLYVPRDPNIPMTPDRFDDA